jgi:hypothetical protein
MFRLDYLSCFLTVLATILVGRRMWTGLVVSCINSLIVCVIGLHTSQYGFVPANLFCICINAFNLRTWLKMQNESALSTADARSELGAGCRRMSSSIRTATRRYRPAEKTVSMPIAWMKPNRHAFAKVGGRVSER